MEQLLRQALSDLAADPVRSAVEILQSVLLLVIVVWGARKFARGRLAERQARISTELGAAEAADREGAELEAKARDVMAGLEQQVADVLKAAREQAEQERGGARDQDASGDRPHQAPAAAPLAALSVPASK